MDAIIHQFQILICSSAPEISSRVTQVAQRLTAPCNGKLNRGKTFRFGRSNIFLKVWIISFQFFSVLLNCVVVIFNWDVTGQPLWEDFSVFFLSFCVLLLLLVSEILTDASRTNHVEDMGEVRRSKSNSQNPQRTYAHVDE